MPPRSAVPPGPPRVIDRADPGTEGEPDLVDALETACALAPGTNVVLDLTSTERNPTP